MDIMNILLETKALLKGHFLLSSGLHSDTYVQCAQVLKYPNYAEEFGKEIANKVNVDVDIVVSPAMGGLIIGHEVASSLKVPFIFTERNDESTMVFRRNFNIEKGQKVLVVEDVITTGKSTKEVVKLIEEKGGIVVGTACIINRSNEVKINKKDPIYLLKVDAKTYTKEECPMCKKGSTPIKPGSRKKI
ncbi:orotate phosphoribosyltransferase [Tepiditoga spiralis]|uniref:Orotate phosphoribosyltransferase n=1 Tax=Tepiditoga spiralis TaxID=2108365 RepID=A0A7G1G632_9BACT|nr:orotate phosphoribosyltransferase [Tepiditoga spiralis]BBE32018.1 orotate phosphoribosyltransferase [Tepiditoga spiralis]